MTDVATEETSAPAADAAASADVTNAADGLLGAAPEAAPEAKKDDAAAAAEAGVKLPGKDATPEEWAEFYKAVGAPESAEAYEVTLPEGDDPGQAALIQQLFKEANILPHQAEKLLSARNRIFGEQMEAAAKAEETRMAAVVAKNQAEAVELKTEWGSDHDGNMHFAKLAAKQFFPAEKAHGVIGAIEQQLGYKETIKFLHGIGKGLAEHDAAGLGAAVQGGARKPTADVLYGSGE